jgi:hypothetical protein
LRFGVSNALKMLADFYRDIRGNGTGMGLLLGDAVAG